jgi:LysR family transcriptional regulator, low CO2-responsive transcriptional regulator
LKHFPNLETFLEAAERGTFTAAARHLGVTQAAVSQRIQQLEVALGAPLFRREGGRVSLTEAGRRLHEYARRIDDLTAEAWAAVTGRPAEPAGELVLAASSVPGQHLLPPTLAVFRRRHPRVRVRVSVSDTDDVLRHVERGEAHLGLVGGRGGGPHLEFRRFACDELVVVVPRGHPWWRKRVVALSDLVAQPLIQREPGSGSRRCLERSLERLGVAASDLNVVLELGSTEAIKEAVLRRVGVASLSSRAVGKEAKAGHLKALHVRGLTLDRDIFLVRDRRRILPRAAQLFLALVNPEPERRPSGRAAP